MKYASILEMMDRGIDTILQESVKVSPASLGERNKSFMCKADSC